MPERSIIVQVAIDENGKKTITVPPASATPDRSHPFLLTIPDNSIGENHATIQIGTNGLLQSAATDETSGADALVKAFATDLGTFTALSGGGTFTHGRVQDCQPSQTYSLEINLEESASRSAQTICGLGVTLERLGGKSPIDSSTRASDYSNAQSGVFYKTEIPYRVTVKSSEDGAQGRVFLAYSPNKAPIQFAPLKKSFFAKNITTITLTDGLATKIESDVGGEFTGFLSLPADAISTYMKAVGGVFDSLKGNSDKKNDTALSDAQRQLCRQAVAANPIQGVDAAKDAANFAAIKAACGN